MHTISMPKYSVLLSKWLRLRKKLDGKYYVAMHVKKSFIECMTLAAVFPSQNLIGFLLRVGRQEHLLGFVVCFSNRKGG